MLMNIITMTTADADMTTTNIIITIMTVDAGMITTNTITTIMTVDADMTTTDTKEEKHEICIQSL